ncbi:hypothetical protein XENTR_v10006363 [Xenopus tropicalis]|nr:hypothetical protein XENTR_v10006363 [Xenopus tropicalis]
MKTSNGCHNCPNTCGTFPCTTFQFQVLNVTQQLNAGVRYLDLRIAHRPDDPSPALYFAHGLFTHITVKDMPTLRLMWNMGYQVILSYDDTMAQFYDFLWPSVPYWWADTTSVSTLIHYLEERKQEGRPGGFFVAGLNLTENFWYIVTHPFGSMKNMTIPKLPVMYLWVQNQNPGKSRHATNIIAEDLIGSDCFVSAVIHLNTKLTGERSSSS